MTIVELLNNIKQNEDYVSKSLLLKSFNDEGCVYKYLFKSNNIAVRKEIFIELNPEESELALLDKTAVNSIEIFPAR